MGSLADPGGAFKAKSGLFAPSPQQKIGRSVSIGFVGVKVGNETGNGMDANWPYIPINADPKKKQALHDMHR